MRHVAVHLSESNAFVEKYHRHSKPVVGHKFSIGADLDGVLVGVAIVGRPVARSRDDGYTLEVLRLATDGTKNACSFLYAACWRAARALGYNRLGTYIRADEPGTTLKAAGWRWVHRVAGRDWDCPSRPRDKREKVDRNLFEVVSIRDKERPT